MIRRIVLSVFAAWVLVSCAEDEVVPRTNPRFSMAYVQEIGPTGAEFVANVYDHGSEEIVEHGFIYSTATEPRIDYGVVLRLAGEPGQSFKLTGDHSMVKGVNYYVVAFVKTEKAIVYSKPVSFTSQGVAGFVFGRLEGGPEVYYGDMLTVHGTGFSVDLSHYQVKINGEIAAVTDLTAGSFKIVIPQEMSFGYPFDYDGKLVISIRVMDKTMELNSDIQFYEPIFHTAEREFAYNEDFYIKGKYLRSRNLYLDHGNYSLEVVTNSDSMIVFKSRAGFETLQPTFRVHLRGRIFEAAGSVQIARTELEPNQHLKIGTIYSHLVIKGTNFNAEMPYHNYFVSDMGQEQQQFYIDGISPTEARVSVYTTVVPNPRFFKVWANNGGVKSSHAVMVENTEPVLSYLSTHTFPFNAAADGRSVNWRDKGIWLLDGKIAEVDPKQKMGRILKRVDIKQGNIASSFAVIHQDVVYFAGENNVLSETPGKFYSYDLNTGDLKELPVIPSKASTPTTVFVSGGYLYFGGGFYRDEVDVHKVSESYKFHLATRTWSPWEKRFPMSSYWDFEVTFVHRGQVFGLVNEIIEEEFRSTKLMRFNQSREDWEEMATYPYLGYANGNVAMSIDDLVYVFIGQKLLKIDMGSYLAKVVPGVSFYDRGYTGPPFLFLSEGKIYYSAYQEYLIHQIDPAYFRD